MEEIIHNPNPDPHKHILCKFIGPVTDQLLDALQEFAHLPFNSKFFD